jgi:hypothetical protein
MKENNRMKRWTKGREYLDGENRYGVKEPKRGNCKYLNYLPL